MKLLKVSSKGFKNCMDGFGIDFVAKARKTSEDKEYELQEIDNGLYVYNTVGIIGKNASGKTSLLNLLDWCYDILSTFKLSNKMDKYDGIYLEIIFYENGYIYKYETDLKDSILPDDVANFVNQKLYRKKYFKSNIKDLYSDIWERIFVDQEGMPEDVAIVYKALKGKKIREIYYSDFIEDVANDMEYTFRLMEYFNMDISIIPQVLSIFDSNITSLEKQDKNYVLEYKGEKKIFTKERLCLFLSSGTQKGFHLYLTAICSLALGFDLIVDEIENHFHKTLVENLILLYKDKNVNKQNASLIFSTHYCEILDMFNRSDNIFITHSRDKIEVENMYENYDLRTELLKSKKFYQNTFDTAVNYDALMDLKKELMK